MQRNFSADININISNNSRNIVSIIPFSDSDKHIAKTLEKVLNHYLKCETDLDLEREDNFKRMTKEFSW